MYQVDGRYKQIDLAFRLRFEFVTVEEKQSIDEQRSEMTKNKDNTLRVSIFGL